MALAFVIMLAGAAVAQVGYDDCFLWCHGLAMSIYELGDDPFFLEYATGLFADCMDQVCGAQM